MAYDTPNRTRTATHQNVRMIDTRKRLVSQYAGAGRYTQTSGARKSALKGLRAALGAHSK